MALNKDTQSGERHDVDKQMDDTLNKIIKKGEKPYEGTDML